MARPEPGHLLIRGGRLAEPGRRRAEAVDLRIEDGIIREVGANLAAPDHAAVFDAAGLLLHPGLINAHTHSHAGLSRGLGDRWTLELLLAAGPCFAAGRRLEEKRLSTTICAAEMVLKGCTAVYDLVAELPLPTRDGMDAVAEAYATVGMRAVVAPMVADRTLYEATPGLMDALPPQLRASVSELGLPGWETTLAAVEDILRHWRWASQDIRCAVAPHVPYHCSDAFLCGCARVARAAGAPLHSHIAESKVQALAGLRHYGRTLLAHMDELGLVGPDFTAAHAVWLDDDDLRLAADRGASLAHNPGSNMRLGNGLFRLRRALDLGVNVGIGTDGPHCSDNQNMYEAMRAASMLSSVQGPDPQAWASAEEVYRAGTVGSARALGFERCGVLAPGMQADIVFLDLAAIHWIPHNVTTNQLVHAEDGTGVRHVMVGGRLLVRDGRLLTVNLADLAARAEAARQRLEEATAAHRSRFEAVAPIIASFCPGMAAQPYRVERYLCDAPPAPRT